MPQATPLRFRFAFTEVNPVVSQVNAGEDDFLTARVYQSRHFISDFMKRTAAKNWPDRRNDAKAAIQKTAVLDLHKGATVAVEPRNSRNRFNDTEFVQVLDEPALIRDDFRHTG